MYNKRNPGKEAGQQHIGKIGVCFIHIFLLLYSYYLHCYRPHYIAATSKDKRSNLDM